MSHCQCWKPSLNRFKLRTDRSSSVLIHFCRIQVWRGQTSTFPDLQRGSLVENARSASKRNERWECQQEMLTNLSITKCLLTKNVTPVAVPTLNPPPADMRELSQCETIGDQSRSSSSNSRKTRTWKTTTKTKNQSALPTLDLTAL